MLTFEATFLVAAFIEQFPGCAINKTANKEIT